MARQGLLLAFCLAFAAPARAQETKVITVHEALMDRNADRIPDRLGQIVTLTGVLTADSIRSGVTYGYTNLQDDTGGIRLFARDASLLVGHFQRGDLVQARGEVAQYKGTKELILDSIQLLGKRQIPRPRDVRTSDLQGERYSGQLVRVRGSLVVPRGFQLRGLALRDPWGEIAVQIPKPAFDDLTFANKVQQGGIVEVTGIAGQLADQPPYDSGYRILARDADDFRFLPSPVSARTQPALEPPLQIISIREATRDDDGDGVPDLYGKRVTVSGILTSDPTIVAQRACLASLQDETGGILLFTRQLDLLVGHFDRGDEVRVTGTITHYFGAKQLLVDDMHFLRTSSVPAPRDVSVADLNSGRYAGLLVRARGKLVAAADFRQTHVGLILEDDSGKIAIRLYGRFFKDREFIQRLSQAKSATVIGYVGQYDSRPPFRAGYQLTPRDSADFVFASPFPYSTVALLLSSLLLAWVVSALWLRHRAAERRAREWAAVSENLGRSREALRMSEEKFFKAFSASPNAISISAVKDGRLVDVNESFLAMSGFRREEVIGRTGEELGLWTRAGDRENFISILREHGKICDKEFAMRGRCGEIRVVRMSGDTIQIGGEPHMLIVARDVTEQRRAEAALRESESKFRLLAELTPAAILVHEGTQLRYVNRAAQVMSGYSEAEFLGMTLEQIVHPDFHPLIEERLGKCIGDDWSFAPIEVKVIKKNGEPGWVDYSAGPFTYQGRTCVLGTAFDITERKQLEEQLRQAQKMEAVGRLAGGVAHDFNNLLAVVLGYSELLLEDSSFSESHQQKLLEIKKAADRAASLTRQLLAFSRKQVLYPRVMDLNSVVANMDKMLRRLIGEHIELATSFHAKPSSVKADPGQLEQVVMNLTLNARDAMPQGGKLTVTTSNITVDDSFAHPKMQMSPGPYVLLSVRDTGEGMDADMCARIFEPFFTTKQLGQGTGLGLATVYGIIKQSGGHISVESAPKCGSTFEVYLPLVNGAQEGLDPSSRLPETSGGSQKILLVEDADGVRALIHELLVRCGYTVLTARSGAEALETAQKHFGAIDLLITDVVMPGMTGNTLAEQLKRLRPNLSVLFMSGYPDDAVSRQGVSLAGEHFLQKPFSAPQLAKKVHALLEQSAAGSRPAPAAPACGERWPSWNA